MVKNDILLWVRCLMTVSIVMFLAMTGRAHAAVLGQTVTNVASVSYDDSDGDSLTVLTNSADFIIEAARTESTIEFFRYSPNAPEAVSHQINGADYSPSGNLAGPFSTMPPAARTGGAPIDTSSPIPLNPASTYFAGELMFVRVIDLGQNGDPNSVETIVITVITSDGDTITLRLYESGPNTGEFWAYMPSSRDTTPDNDQVITTPQGTTLTATYVDSFDATEVSVDTALVDPYGRVFNGLTGELIDDVRVTIIDAATGEPADVFGIDGMSTYPSSMLTGETITDSSGLIYDMRPGEFRFPLIALGEYFVRVDPPEGLSFASILTEADFALLNNAPFIIGANASYGRSFTLDGSGPLNFDIPLDAQTDLILAKTASVTSGDVGDFIGYTVTVENRGKAGAPVKLRDTMPRGFKYVEGSSKLGGVSFADPQITDSGRILTYSLGALGVTETLSLSYVLEIGAGAKDLDRAINAIVAVDNLDENVSNIARANVKIREDLMRSHSTIVGRISENSCDGDEDWARDIKRGDGVEGVRLYMETGAYAITDQDGLYHFEGVKEGTHVVQLDEETLPEGFTPMICEESTRYAGKAISKFVEVQGGGIWRANFYLKQTGEVKQVEAQEIFNDLIEYKTFDSNWLGTQTDDIEMGLPFGCAHAVHSVCKCWYQTWLGPKGQINA